MDRSELLIRDFNKNARLIEVGPSINPVAAKRNGWNTVIVDHATQEELAHKYSGEPGVDVSQIESVDFIWRSGSLAETIPSNHHGTFDAFIASHVIEHTTDIVSFLKSAELLISQNGVIILIIPDKRKGFDLYRHPSTTGDAIAALHEKRERHDIRTHFEYYMRSAHKEGHRGWAIDDARAVTLSTPFEFANEPFKIAAEPGYIDAHNWIFVPSSFDLMLTELSALGYLDLRAERIAEVRSTEFHVWLRRGREVFSGLELQARRKLLMDRIVIELAEQALQVQDNIAKSLPLGRNYLDPTSEANARTEAVQIILSAVLASQNWRGINKKKFKKIVADAASALPKDGPKSVMHQVLFVEANKVLSRAK